MDFTSKDRLVAYGTLAGACIGIIVVYGNIDFGFFQDGRDSFNRSDGELLRDELKLYSDSQNDDVQRRLGEFERWKIDADVWSRTRAMEVELWRGKVDSQLEVMDDEIRSIQRRR